jgi:tRNA (Thr-GGU) A37 N-methylase
MKEINLKPIGVVKNNIKELRFGNFADEISEIIMDDKFAGALTGIDDYSHVVIVYWMDKIKNYVITHRPQGNPRRACCGHFCLPLPSKAEPQSQLQQ